MLDNDKEIDDKEIEKKVKQLLERGRIEKQVKRPSGVTICAIWAAIYWVISVFIVVTTIADSARWPPYIPILFGLLFIVILIGWRVSYGLFKLENGWGWKGAIVLYGLGIFLIIFPALVFFLVAILNIFATWYLFKVKDVFIR